MYALVIGASRESIFAIRKAQNMGFTVIAFDGDPQAEGLSCADISHVTDIRDPQNIIKKLDGIIPSIVLPVPIGRYLISAAAINDYYVLKGIGFDAADNCTDKYAFHNLLAGQGLRDAKCLLIPAGTSFINNEISYPVVIKPRFGSGNTRVFAAVSQKDLQENFIAGMPYDEDYIIETMADGTEYGVDAAVANGKYQTILLREKILTPLPFRQCVGYYSVPSVPEYRTLQETVASYLKSAVKVLGFDHCLLHADILYKSGQVFLIEISARPSGHNLHNLFTPIATGVDMLEEYIKYAVPDIGQKYSFDVKKHEHMLIRYFDFENCIITQKPDRKELMAEYPLLEYECHIGNEKLGRVKDGHSIMGRGYFILKADDRESLKFLSDEILRKFKTKFSDNK